eukprot:Trichotokara_eunicae@DN5253_c0_g1_i4.p1
MLEVKTEDLAERAISEMIRVINQLIDAGPEYDTKVKDCITALRSGCLDEGEHENYNSFILTLIDTMTRMEFVQNLWDSGLYPIHSEEYADSTITKDE